MNLAASPTAEPSSPRPASFTFGGALNRAAARLAGSKRALLGALAVAVLITSLLRLLLPLGASMWLRLLLDLALTAATAPLWALVVVVAIDRARGDGAPRGTLDRGIGRWRTYVGLALAVSCVTTLITVASEWATYELVSTALSLGGGLWVFLTWYSVFFAVERGYGVIASLRASVTFASKNLVRLFALHVVLVLLVGLATLPAWIGTLLGVPFPLYLLLAAGVLWALPYALLASAAAYLGARGEG